MEEKASNLKPSRKGFVTNYPYFRQWKKIKPEGMTKLEPLIIYLHIPFCMQRCSYCYYSTTTLQGKKRKEKLNKYVDTLCHEIQIASKYFQLKNRPVISIYFGGGTPTVMNEGHFSKIMEALHNNLNIENPEFTVEAEPVTLTAKKAQTLQNIGVNRISLGVQSLDNDIIKLCNRLDTADRALKAIDIAKNTADVVNIDLLSGLAGETMESWSYTLDKALSTEVESITVYKMELYANTEYYRKIRSDAIEIPSDEIELDFMNHALNRFEEENYLPWSFFTFTKQGLYENVYASDIWRGTDCYAFGVSAFGSLGNWLFQNTNEQDKYITLVNSDKIPINRGKYMNSLDQMIRSIMLGMKLSSFDLNKFQNKYGFKLQTLCSDTLNNLEKEEFIIVSDDYIKMTNKGLLYGDYTGKYLAGSLMAFYK